MNFSRRTFLASAAAAGVVVVGGRAPRRSSAAQVAADAAKIRTSNHLDADLHLFLNREELAASTTSRWRSTGRKSIRSRCSSPIDRGKGNGRRRGGA